MYSEENKSSNLAKFLSIYDYVFVDTCSLMEDGFPIFMDTLVSSKDYWKDGLKVIVPGECVKELRKHSKSNEKAEAQIEAKRALKILRHDKWHGKTLEIAKCEGESDFADNAIYTKVSGLRIQNKILVITQDKTLTSDLLAQNNLNSQHGRYLDVYKINAEGGLEPNPGETGNYHSRERYSNSRYEKKGRGLFGSRSKTPSRRDTEERAIPRIPSHTHYPHPHMETKIVAETPKEQSFPEIMAADQSLYANLKNPNYPTEKRIADIDAQLSRISSLKSEEKATLYLACSEKELRQTKDKLMSQSSPKATISSEEPKKPMKSEKILRTEESKEVKKEPISAPAPKAVSAPAQEAEPKEVRPAAPKGWFEFGRNIAEGASKCATHMGFLIRDPSIPYIKEVHGPYDITTADVDNAAKGIVLTKTGDSGTSTMGPFTLYAEKTAKDYKVMLLPRAEEKKPATVEPTQAPSIAKPVEEQAVKKPEPVAKTSQKATIAVEKEAKPAHKAPSKRSAPTKEAPKTESHAKPASTVKKASPKPTKETTKAPTKKAAPAVNKKKGKEDSIRSKSMDDKEKKATSNRDTVKTPDLSTAVPVGVSLMVGVPDDENKRSYIERRSRRLDNADLSTIQPNSKERTAAKTRRVTPPLRKPKAVVPDEPMSDDFKKVHASELRLNANLGNPNYPVANKIRDLKSQDLMVASLSPSDAKRLKLNHEKIMARLAEFEKK